MARRGRSTTSTIPKSWKDLWSFVTLQGVTIFAGDSSPAFFNVQEVRDTSMLGLMQDFPLIISRLLSYAERFHRHTEIVSRRLEGDIHRYSYADMATRARQLANALNL